MDSIHSLVSGLITALISEIELAGKMIIIPITFSIVQNILNSTCSAPPQKQALVTTHMDKILNNFYFRSWPTPVVLSIEI